MLKNLLKKYISGKLNNMAYIYKRGSKWAYRAYAGKDAVTGKDKQASKSGFLTKKDAQLAAALFERQFHSGEYVQPSAITFQTLSEDFLKHYLTQGVKKSSHRTRKSALKHINNEFGTALIQKIKKKDYQDLIDKLSGHLSPNTISIVHSSANMVFTYAHENKLIKDIPSSKIKLPKKRKTVADIESDSINEKFLEKEELEEFLLAAKNEGLEGDLLIFTTLAYTGLRTGELISLKWTDIDFKNQTLRVTKTYYNPNHKKDAYELTPPKTKNSIRTITIDSVVVGLLESHKSIQDQVKVSNRPFYIDNNFIFATNEGYPHGFNFISNRLRRLLDKTKINKKITPHSFRHTHTSLLIEANVHIKEIQERLGHGDIATTLNIYSHLTKNMKKEASNKFGDLMKDLSNIIST